MEPIEIILLSILFLIVYPYFIYPVILYLLSIFLSKKLKKKNYEPKVTLIISAYNEEKVIESKILNSLGLDYPNYLMQIIVVSDKSSDSTDEIVKRYVTNGVELFIAKERNGKTAGLNSAILEAKGEVVVFSDADAMYQKDSIKKMVSLLSDNSIGLVTGSTDYVETINSDMVATSSLYTRLERYIKKMESRLGSCVGADGAVFAMKRELYIPLRDDDINDLVIPLNVVKQGHRVILGEEIKCSEPPSDTLEGEFKRQVRITNRTLNALFRNIELMNLLAYPLFSFQIISHKILRFAVPLFMIIAMGINIMVLNLSIFYKILLFGQVLFYLLAILAYLVEKITSKPNKLNIISHFLMVQISMLFGWWGFISGKRQVIWKPRN